MMARESTGGFDQRLARLEEIVRGLEDESGDLDAALRLFEEGIETLRGASADLARADARVKLLVENNDGTFDLTDAADDERR